MNIWAIFESLFKKAGKSVNKVVIGNTTKTTMWPGPAGIQGTPGIHGKNTQKCGFCGESDSYFGSIVCGVCGVRTPACRHCGMTPQLDSFLNELDPNRKEKVTKLGCSICKRNEKINRLLG